MHKKPLWCHCNVISNCYIATTIQWRHHKKIYYWIHGWYQLHIETNMRKSKSLITKYGRSTYIHNWSSVRLCVLLYYVRNSIRNRRLNKKVMKKLAGRKEIFVKKYNFISRSASHITSCCITFLNFGLAVN